MAAIARDDASTELRLFADLDAVVRWRERDAVDAPQRLGARSWPRAQVAPDDLLDAYAVLWTALRVARGPGQYRELGDARRDARGLRMQIVV